AEERPVVAAVFLNRLKGGMRLQTDPTVIYGMGENYEGNIRKKDLTADTPWNTYTREGLPPTPIAMPGAASLDAATHPAQAPFLAAARQARTEALVMCAARAEHVAGVIEPALGAGRWIVCDRFSDATFAYQCGGRGLPREVVVGLERLVHPGLQPDATFLFDLDPALAYDRARARSRTPDKFEREQADFFRRVREAYMERAREHSRRFHVIDAAGELAEVRDRVEIAFVQAFP